MLLSHVNAFAIDGFSAMEDLAREESPSRPRFVETLLEREGAVDPRLNRMEIC